MRWVLALAAVGCATKTETVTDPSPTGETGTGTTDTATTRTWTQVLPQRVGEATVDDTYAGTEEIQVLPLLPYYYYGDPVCVILTNLVSTGSRQDCADEGSAIACDFAFDVVITDAQVLHDDGYCLAVTGYDADNVASLEGTVLTRGFHGDYSKHIPSLMVDQGDGWERVADAQLEGDTFTYVWADSFFDL